LRGLFQTSQFNRRRRGDKPETLAALTPQFQRDSPDRARSKRVVRQTNGPLFERRRLALFQDVILSEEGSPATAAFAVAGVGKRRIYAFFPVLKYIDSSPPLRSGSE
jgi:hypothetical protein